MYNDGRIYIETHKFSDEEKAHMEDVYKWVLGALSPPPKAGWVYFIRGDRWIKIGSTINPPEAKVKQWSPLPPWPISLVNFIFTPDRYGLERRLHLHFEDKRAEGEWFELDDADLRWLDTFKVEMEGVNG